MRERRSTVSHPTRRLSERDLVSDRSGDYSFDLDAQGAVESAGNNRAFGPLPNGFSDDVLPVIFSFDPTVVH